MNKTTKATNVKSTKLGSYSAFLTLVVIAFVVVVNLIVGELPTTLTKLDTSSLQLYTLSGVTTSMLENLNEDVTMYYIAQNGTEDANIEEMLGRYASYSRHISIKTIDPTSNPSFSKKYTDAALSNNSVIVESAKRSSVVTYEEIYTTEYSEEELMNYYYYGTTPTGTSYFNGESVLTTALDYVTSDNLPVLYITTGHGEATVSDTVKGDAKSENILTSDLALLTVTEIPADAGSVLINAPTSDISDEELQVLLTYMELGGKVVLITDFASYSEEAMPNLAALTHAYGLAAESGLLMEGDSKAYLQAPFYILPKLNAEADVAANMSSTNVSVLTPMAHGIKRIDAENKFVEPILSTSADAYVISDPDARVAEYADSDTPAKAYEKQDSDPSGTFYTAAYSEDLTTGGKMMWISSAYFISEGYYNYNSELFMSAMTILNEKSSSISILGKALQIQSLAVSAAAAGFWGVVMILILPVGAAVIGLIIWNKRRKR